MRIGKDPDSYWSLTDPDAVREAKNIRMRIRFRNTGWYSEVNILKRLNFSDNSDKYHAG
jgi:hypothetical protein